MDVLTMEIASEAQALRDELVSWRRDFHRYPELAYQENRSAEVVADALRKWGFEVETSVARTGVVGLLRCNTEGPWVMARFDMDALPIHEDNEIDYVSKHQGVMHACGHDAHLAMGLGVAALLAKYRDELSGGVILVFQPAEEAGTGAQEMIAHGVLDSPRPGVFLAAHVWNDIPVGTVDVSSGPVMAASTEWTCLVEGRGGHGAVPHQTVDPVLAASRMVVAAHTLVGRSIPASEPAVVSVGKFCSGDALNVIPERAEFGGTIRTYSAEWQKALVERLEALFSYTAASQGATAKLTIVRETPALHNNPQVCRIVRAAARSIVGKDAVSGSVRTTGSEDAAFFAQQIPSCFFFLGSSNPQRGVAAPLHSPRFDVDEAVLPLGTAVIAKAIVACLANYNVM